MQYISPVSLLKTLDIHEFDKKALALARKKLLIELELNGGNTITLNGRELTKNDIINLFDNLNLDKDLHYYIAVAGDPVLLHFLETGKLTGSMRFKPESLYYEDGFINWVSPYYCTSFCRLALQCLTEMRDDEWMALSANPLLMNMYDAEKAWQLVENAITPNLKKLCRFVQNKGYGDRDAVQALTNFRYISMLQKLPAKRFTALKDEYAWATMQCSVYIFNKVNRATGLTMVENALLLAVSAEVREGIAGKEIEMQTFFRGRKRRTEDKIARIIVIGLLITFILYVIILAIRDSGTTYINKRPAPANGDSVITLRQLDSMYADSTGTKAKDTTAIKKSLRKPAKNIPKFRG